MSSQQVAVFFQGQLVYPLESPLDGHDGPRQRSPMLEQWAAVVPLMPAVAVEYQ